MRDPATRAADIHAHMLETYRRLLGEQRAAVAAMFGLLLAGRAPLLINCTAGKDRTGVLSALLLAALGVPLETVRTDYALTELIQDPRAPLFPVDRSEEHTSELQSLMRISYAVFCFKKK